MGGRSVASAACHFTNEVAVVAEQADLAGDR